MISTEAYRRKICAKCLKHVNIYTTCFDCDAIYHIYCLKKVPGVLATPQGQLFCCRSITSKHGTTEKNLQTQDNPLEKIIDKKGINDLKEDLGDCLHKEDVDRNDFKGDTCSLEFSNKEQLEAHYREFCKEEAGLIQESNGDQDLGNCLHKEEDLDRNDFKCDACSLEFSNKEQLEAHYQEFCNEEAGLIQESNGDQAGSVCPFCKKERFQKESYEQHIKRCEKYNSGLNTVVSKRTAKAHILPKHSNSEKRHKCNDCKYSTRRKANLVIHMRIHSNEKPFKCESCNYAATQRPSLNTHILAKHSNAEKRYKCNDCKYSTNNKWDLVQHVWIHSNDRPFKCDMCDYTAIRHGSLTSHILEKHSNSEKRYKCNGCKYSTHEKRRLAIHMCIHSNEKPFKCESCNYTATQRSNLNSHILVKHSNAEKKYKCNDCKYSAHKKDAVVRHMFTHTNEKPFKCESCDYGAIRSTELKAHILAKHSNANAEKRYKCNYCKYSANERRDLVTHIRIHTNERPFKCDICDYTARLKGTLTSHISAKHYSSGKRYECNNCKYFTQEKRKLTQHMRIHTHRKRFKCVSCDYATDWGSNLKLHILSKHSNAEKRYKCNDCTFATYRKCILVRHIQSKHSSPVQQ